MYKKSIFKRNTGITLVALVITIIVLLILAGVTLNLTLGENGLIKRTEASKAEYTKAQIKEELEMLVMDIQSNDSEARKQIISEKTESRLNDIGATVIIRTEEFIQGEYKDYEYSMDQNGKITVGNQLTEAKPTGRATLITTESGILEAQIEVTAEIEEGEITQIQPLDNNVELIEDKGNADKIYKVTENKTYRFMIKGSSGRILIVNCEVSNIMLSKTDIFTAIEDIKTTGISKVQVKGKTSTEENTEIYSLNVIYHEGDMVLDGSTSFEGSTLSNNVYEFGDAVNDTANASRNAQNTVVLKVEGNLTINSGVTLTSAKNAQGYGGPKGMIVYCSGELTNNGTISMTARGAKAEGQNVYLLKNEDGSFEYVPKAGTSGGRNCFS